MNASFVSRLRVIATYSMARVEASPVGVCELAPVVAEGAGGELGVAVTKRAHFGSAVNESIASLISRFIESIRSWLSEWRAARIVWLRR
jgi:hypothetical protein